MKTNKALGLLAALALVSLFASGLPALAEEGSPEAAQTAGAQLCSDGSAPSLPGFAGEAPDLQPAQATCGPCLLEFCPEVGVRCDFTGCGPNDCCAYSCSCDSTCTNTGTPFNVCRLSIPCCGICGNNVRQCNEVCDGTDLAGTTCVDLGFHGGTLACQSNCLGFDTSGCIDPPVCGNGTCEWGEDCETCSDDCEGRQTGKPSNRFCCGNGVAESAEGNCSICDGNC